MAHHFTAVLGLIGINPFVFVPDNILQVLFSQSGKRRGHIPIRGTVNGKAYRQTLLRYSGAWRLYVNMTMLKGSPDRIGEEVQLTIEYDPESRHVATPEKFSAALKDYPEANTSFKKLSDARKQEIVRHLARLKTTEALERNISKAIDFLLGKSAFLGRYKP